MEDKPFNDRIITSSIPQLDEWMDYLNDTLGKVAPFNVVSAEQVTKVPRPCLSQWCEMKGLWQIITTELVDWCKDLIKGRPAIEVCAGRGSLGRALGIPQVDSSPTPGTGVEAASALEAVAQYKPQVVIGAWTVQRGTQEVPQSEPGGIDEEALVKSVDCYVLVGNSHAHSFKRIMALKHKEQHFKWLVSRSPYANEETICVWGS